MDNKIFNWCGYEWLTEERWGNLHPDRPWAWDDPGCVKVNDNNELELSIDLNPKKIIINGREYNPNYGMGLVSTTANNPKFKYGHYEWIAKMPKGKHLWPALWMWSWDSWPPEIDVVEAWTNCGGGYFRLNYKWHPLVWNLQTNYHEPNEDGNMAQCCSVFDMPDPARNFIKYELIWLPGELQFWYNDKQVRTINDPEFMKYLNENTNNGMNIIMNIHPTEKYHEGELKTTMLVKSFKYTPIQMTGKFIK